MRRSILPALALQLPIACVCICVCAALGARPAAAGRTVLVVDASPLTIDHELRQETVQRTVAVLRGTGRWLTVAGGPAGNTAARVDELLERAKTLSEQFQEQQAVQTLAEAEQLFRRSFGAQPAIKPLTQILLARIKLDADLGLKDELRQELERLAVLEPSLTLDAGTFPPQLVRTFRQVQSELASQQATLEVTVTPANSMIWVDGKQRGNAPLRINVVPGEHFVAVGPPGLSRGRSVVVQSDAPEKLVLALDDPQHVSDAELRAKGQQAGATWVVAVTLNQQGPRYQLRLRAVPIDFVEVPCRTSAPYVSRGRLTGATTNLGLELDERLRHGCTSSPRARRPAKEQPTQGSSVLGSWWFWTIAAAVVGGGTAAAVVLTRDNDPGVRVHLTH